jgi:hypothetical protein
VNALVGPELPQGIVTYLNSGYPLYSGYGFEWPVIDLPPTATKYRRLYKRESPYFQTSYSQEGTYTADLVTLDEVISRGALLHQWEFEMSPHSSTTLSLEHDGPFFVVVEDYKVFMTPDGGTAYGYEEIDELTSTENTVESPETEAPDPVNEVNAPEVEYTTGPEAPPADREAVVEDLQTLNDNQEARHTDEAGILRQIRKGIEDVVGSIAGLAGGLQGDPGEETTSEHEHEEGFQDKVDQVREDWDEFWEEVDGLYDDVGDFVGSVNPTIPAGTPGLFIEMEIPWSTTTPKGKITLQSTPAMDTWVAIARGICMVALLIIATDAILTTTRKAFV